MSGAHTPGPWVINPRHPSLISTEDNDADIAEVDGWPVDLSAEQEANKRLIAAAPELLSSLRHLRAFWKPGSNHDTDEVQRALAAADAAIAKAEGRS